MSLSEFNDNRRTLRMTYITPAAYTSGAICGKGTVKNVGPGGMFLKTTEAFPAGAKIDIEFQFRHSRQKINLRGEIVRRASDGLGIKLLW